MRYGKGWHGEPLRHSRAKKFGKAGGHYANVYKTKKTKFSLKPSKRIDFPKKKGNSIHTVIVVPSTKDFDKPITKKEYEARANEVKKFVSEELATKDGGGFTEIKGAGGWVEDDKVVQEPVKEVHNYTTPEVWKKKDLEVKAFLEKKRKEWGQSAIGFQYEESMHFIK